MNVASLPRIFVLAPEGLLGWKVAAAACRADALGVLDAARAPESELRTACERIAELSPGAFGIRLPMAEALGSAGLIDGFKRLEVFILKDIRETERLAEAIDRCRRHGRWVLAEVTSRDEARQAVAAGAIGVVAAGHEAGGAAGDESSFVLMQAILSEVDAPVYVRGGIGPRVAAGCRAAGAYGVVLDGAVLLSAESSVKSRLEPHASRWDGSETVWMPSSHGCGARCIPPWYQRPGTGESAVKLDQREIRIGWSSGDWLPLGQDAAFAWRLARTLVTTGGIVRACMDAMGQGAATAAEVQPLAEGSSFARALGTRYPILQGPMTRVSDVAPFAEAVAREGALPFLALAMMRGEEVHRLLRETEARLQGRPWGVGILGFVPPELRREQVQAVLEVRPPCCLIAGGRPDQAAELEEAGIATFLHAPSPALLDHYLGEGCRRFVLEGWECGGHVGPRSSFVLWEQAIATVEDAIDRGLSADELFLVFAGGIHDARSAAFVAAMTAALARKGVKIGILVGTAYLFTREAVASGAIVPEYQAEALRCRKTVLLESGPGHQVRVTPTPFVERFERERARLQASGLSAEEVREALERLNVGRLRIATKGLDRANGASSPLVKVDVQVQLAEGLYMIGQAAGLRSQATTIAALHAELVGASAARIAELARSQSARSASNPSDIAIVGLSSVFPGAIDAARFWSNTLLGRDSVTEVPLDHWDWRLYYDPDPKAPDKIISKWGGFVPDVPFDPLRYGMPPASLPSIEPAQLIALECARQALADAGYAERPFARERTAVVLGMGGGAAQLAMGYAFRSYLPMLEAASPSSGSQVRAQCEPLLPEWTEDSFPGFLLNVTAGRIANRLNLGGANYTVDAACGSSLAALALGVRELETGAADVVLLGGVDTVQNPFTYLAFSKTQAFSPEGRCRPFDAGANGIVISEGAAFVVLKRLADAERDGDRIYAVVKGVGASSDARARGLTAPVVAGQERALARAYQKAGVEPNSVGYFEAHGTGTALGDQVELKALGNLLAQAQPGSAVVGSVKSLIGHAKCAAGLAGLLNATLALHHKLLPPTIGIRNPTPCLNLEQGPLTLRCEAAPWLHEQEKHPRRAGVSAFGFGGANFHAVLEEYQNNLLPQPEISLTDWPAELFLWRGGSLAELRDQVDRLRSALESGARPRPADLAHTLAVTASRQDPASAPAALAIVASDLAELAERLRQASRAIERGPETEVQSGIELAAAPAFAGAKVALLFPGQGVQRPGMLRELAVVFPCVRAAFEECDRVLTSLGRKPVGRLIFPASRFDDKARQHDAQILADTENAQPALAAAAAAIQRLLGWLGLEADLYAGHSFGELAAVHAAGALDATSFFKLAAERARLMRNASQSCPGAMAALAADPATISTLVTQFPSVSIANHNSPTQIVVAGPEPDLNRLVEHAQTQGITAARLQVSGAFHTDPLATAATAFAAHAAQTITRAPARPVFANLDARPHPSSTEQLAHRLGQQLSRPVQFAAMIDAIYQAGARVFIDAGPGRVLANLVHANLDPRPHLTVALDSPGTSGLASFLQALAQLFTAGVAFQLDRLTTARNARLLHLDNLPKGEWTTPITPSTWLVNGCRSRPFNGPEPPRLGACQSKNATPPPTANGSHTHSADQNTRINHHPTTPLHTPPPTRPAPRPHPIATSPTPPARDHAMQAFQETMRAFLETQKAAMLAYFQAQEDSPCNPPSFQPAPAASSAANGSFATSASPNGDTPGGSIGRHHDSSRPEPSCNGHAAEREPTFATNTHPAPPDRSQVAGKLLEIVRDRTGYPIETLGLELDIEAELGIDSIKRVEILSKLRDQFPTLKERTRAGGVMDALARARTLGAIVDRMSELLEAKAPTGQAAASRSIPAVHDQHGGSTAAAKTLSRLLLTAVDAPLKESADALAPGGCVIVSQDGQGVANALKRRLESQGTRVELIGGDDHPIDWSSPASVTSVVERIRRHGPIAALVHLAPLAQTDETIDSSHWSQGAETTIKGLFLLAQAIREDLEQAAAAGAAGLVAAVHRMTPLTPNGRPIASHVPGHGGIAGLVKTLAREWPTVPARIVDLHDAIEPAAAALALHQELLARDGWPEILRQNGRRLRLLPLSSPLDPARIELDLPRGAPIIVSGGARGMTAIVLAELAQFWKPNLLILGSTPLPQHLEPADTASLTHEAEIKSAILNRLRQDDSPPRPALIEDHYQTLIKTREIKANLARLAATGSGVEYAAVDVRNAQALAPILDSFRTRHGPIAGLIHAAGLIQDKLIRDKSPASFDKVLGAKLAGARNLIQLVNVENLRFAAFFSSIAGRFGNVGQADYAAANEFLSKLALWLDGRMQGRVVSMIWGPWSGVGMVARIENHLERSGLGMIQPHEGARLLLDELRHGRKGEVEVIHAAGLGTLDQPIQRPRPEPVTTTLSPRAPETAR